MNDRKYGVDGSDDPMDEDIFDAVGQRREVQSSHADFLREIARQERCEADLCTANAFFDLAGRHTAQADRLTALADRLQDGVIVPREPTEAMLDAGVEKMDSPFDDASGRRECKKIYRAMLTASEAK